MELAGEIIKEVKEEPNGSQINVVCLGIGTFGKAKIAPSIRKKMVQWEFCLLAIMLLI